LIIIFENKNIILIKHHEKNPGPKATLKFRVGQTHTPAVLPPAPPPLTQMTPLLIGKL